MFFTKLGAVSLLRLLHLPFEIQFLRKDAIRTSVSYVGTSKKTFMLLCNANDTN
jgi:hypothetical protein